MQAMRIIKTTASQWGVFVQMRGVLLKAGAERKAGQEKSSGDARRNSQISREPWPGAHLGIRRPDIDETPLSIDECLIAMKDGTCNA